ncbi:MAG: hypothetical protein AAFX94_02280 [Myxococcota bacterium]
MNERRPKYENEPDAPKIIVTDRRHWARDDEDDGEVTERKPTVVQQLEDQLAAQKAAVAEIKAQHKSALEEFENARATSCSASVIGHMI